VGNKTGSLANKLTGITSYRYQDSLMKGKPKEVKLSTIGIGVA